MRQLKLQKKDLKINSPVEEQEAELGKAISQLTKNYDILRRQTTHGFTISSIFMSVGLLIILAGITGELFKLQGDTKTLTIAAGILVEFISGTALFLYRLNFKRLNETSDKLLATWKILTAFNKTNDLSAEKKDEMIVELIRKLSK